MRSKTFPINSWLSCPAIACSSLKIKDLKIEDNSQETIQGEMDPWYQGVWHWIFVLTLKRSIVNCRFMVYYRGYSSATALWKALIKIWGFVFFLITLLVREAAWSGHLIFSLTCSVCGQNIALPVSPAVGTSLMTLLKGEEKLNGKRHKYLSLLKPGNGNSKISKEEKKNPTGSAEGLPELMCRAALLK